MAGISKDEFQSLTEPSSAGGEKKEVKTSNGIGRREFEDLTTPKSDFSKALSTIHDAMTIAGSKKLLTSSYTHGLYAYAREVAIRDFGDRRAEEELQHKQEEERAARAARGEKDQTVAEGVKSLPGSFKSLGKSFVKEPLNTSAVMLTQILPDLPLMALMGQAQIPAKIAQVAAGLSKAEKASKLVEAGAAAGEGFAVGAAGSAGESHARTGKADVGEAVAAGGMWATMDAGARVVGMLARKNAPKEVKLDEEGMEYVNVPGSAERGLARRETPVTFAGRGSPTPWRTDIVPTDHENAQARAFFGTDAEFGQYLAVESSQRMAKEGSRAMTTAVDDAHAATKETKAEVNGKRTPEDISDVEVKEILTKAPGARTPADRMKLSKWQLRGMMGVAGGATIAYALADEDTKKGMVGAGLAMAAPFVFPDAKKIAKADLLAEDIAHEALYNKAKKEFEAQKEAKGDEIAAARKIDFDHKKEIAQAEGWIFLYDYTTQLWRAEHPTLGEVFGAPGDKPNDLVLEIEKQWGFGGKKIAKADLPETGKVETEKNIVQKMSSPELPGWEFVEYKNGEMVATNLNTGETKRANQAIVTGLLDFMNYETWKQTVMGGNAAYKKIAKAETGKTKELSPFTGKPPTEAEGNFPAGGPVVSWGGKPPEASTNPQIHTQDFQMWWYAKGTPAIADANGNPMVFWHRTPAGHLEEFDPAFSKYGNVAMFSSPDKKAVEKLAQRDSSELINIPEMGFSPEQLKDLDAGAIRVLAKKSKVSHEEVIKRWPIRELRKTSEWRELAKSLVNPNMSTIPVFVRLTKPFDYQNPEHLRVVNDLVRKNHGHDMGSGVERGTWGDIQRIQDELIQLGFDGYFEREGGAKNLAVFDPKDIKHAEENTGQFLENKKIRGSAQTEFMIMLGAAGLGVVIGSQVDKESPVRGEILGALAGLFGGRVAGKALEHFKIPEDLAGRKAREAAETLRPGALKDAAMGMAQKIPGGEKAPQAKERVRVKEAIDNHQTRLARASREIMQVVQKVVKAVPSVARRIEIGRALDGEMVKLTPTERVVYEEMKAAFKRIGDDAVAMGVLDELRETYITHLVKKGQEEKLRAFLNAQKTPSMSPNSPYAKKRTFEGTMTEMEKAGIELVTRDAAAIYSHYAYAMTRTIANKELLTALAKDSRGIFKAAGSKGIPPGFVTVDRPLLTGIRVHPDIAPELSALFDTRDPDAWMKVASAVSTAAKRAEVSFSLMHAVSLTQAYIASQAKIKHGLAGAAVGAGLAAATGNDPYTIGLAAGAAGMALPLWRDMKSFTSGQHALLKELREGGVGDSVDGALRAGLKLSMEKARFEREPGAVVDVGQDFYTGMEMLQGFVDKFIHPVGGKAVEQVIRANHWADNWMWGRLQAGMKLQVYMDKKSKLLRENAKARDTSPAIPLLSDERAGEIAASYANSLFGGMNWTKLMEGTQSKFGRQVAAAMTSPTGMRYLNFLMFAPDWTISTTLSAVRAFDLRPSQAELAGLHRQYMIRAALWTVAVGDAINYASTGHHMWENEDPTSVELGDGSKMNVSKHFFDPIHEVQKPAQEALNKMGAVPAEAMEQLTDKEYLSTKGAPSISGNEGRLAHLGKRFLPFGATGSWQGALGVPVYPPKEGKKKKKSAQDYLDESLK